MWLWVPTYWQDRQKKKSLSPTPPPCQPHLLSREFLMMARINQLVWAMIAATFSPTHHSQSQWLTHPKFRILSPVPILRWNPQVEMNWSLPVKVWRLALTLNYPSNPCTLVKFKLTPKQIESLTLWTTAIYLLPSNLTLTQATCSALAKLSAPWNPTQLHVLS